MSRRIVWLQLLIGWLPVWGLFTALIMTAHQSPWLSAAGISLRMVICAAVPGLAVQRLTKRMPWPARVRLPFLAVHIGAATAYAIVSVALNSVGESVMRGHLVIVVGYSFASYLLVGVWLYVMIAGVSYTRLAGERVARAEGNAARAQLAALRSQLNPHFLFNALHTVVQLIPREPARAAQAAEQLAGLLRVAIEEDRDVVSVSEELAFVERYLDVERIRFGERLRVHVEVSEAARGASIPVFSLQTLVENAVRHAAAPRVEATDIWIDGRIESAALCLVVRDSGPGATANQLEGGGTGVRRLRDRLLALYGSDGRLEFTTEPARGFSATLVIPYAASDA